MAVEHHSPKVPGHLAVRTALLVGSLAMLWLTQRAFESFNEDYAESFRLSVGAWLGYLGLGVIGGLLLGASLVLPKTLRRFRWSVALSVAALPILLLGYLMVVFAVVLPETGRLHPAYTLWGHLTPFLAPGPQFVLATIVGAAISTGFAHR